MGKFLEMMSQNDSKALVARASQINVQAKTDEVLRITNVICNIRMNLNQKIPIFVFGIRLMGNGIPISRTWRIGKSLMQSVF